MDQRHQAFIVARVVPSPGKAARYQCIGALHQQWCSGHRPLRAALRFFTLIKQPQNAEIIREELRGIEFAGQDLSQERKDTPCPFTQFLFLSAWGISLDDPANPVERYVHNLQATMEFDEGDNNDGLTIIDVTDPENPACCFIANNRYPFPINAEAYLSRYYARHEHLEILIRSFDDIPLFPASVIGEAWSAWFPKGTWKTSQQAVPLKQEVSSLVELTLRPAIEQAIAERKDDVLDFIQMDSSRVALAKDVIRSQNQVSDGVFSLLKALVSVDDNKTLNLSGFALSGKQIVDMLALCRDSGIVSLNLSHNPSLQVDDLDQILQGAPQTIRRLVLFGSGITDEEMVRLLDAKPQLFYHLESIIHPIFLSGFYAKNPVKYTPRFTYARYGRSSYSTQCTVSLPYFTPNTLAQGLTDLLAPIPMLDMESESRHKYRQDVYLSAMSAYAACSRPSDLPWGQRTVACVPYHGHNAKHPQKGEWKFVLVNTEDLLRTKYEYYYTIMRPNKAGEEFLSDANSPKTKHNDIFLRPDLVDVFDIRGFFKELEREGRPSPDPEVFQKLLDLFSVEGDDKVFTFLDCEAMKEKIPQRSQMIWL